MKASLMVQVEWLDSHGREGWHSDDDVSELLDKLLCRSVGYLVVDDRRGVIIALGQGSEQLLSSMAIPREAIRSITTLAESTDLTDLDPVCYRSGCHHHRANHPVGAHCAIPGCSCAEFTP